MVVLMSKLFIYLFISKVSERPNANVKNVAWRLNKGVAKSSEKMSEMQIKLSQD